MPPEGDPPPEGDSTGHKFHYLQHLHVPDLLAKARKPGGPLFSAFDHMHIPEFGLPTPLEVVAQDVQRIIDEDKAKNVDPVQTIRNVRAYIEHASRIIEEDLSESEPN